MSVGIVTFRGRCDHGLRTSSNAQAVGGDGVRLEALRVPGTMHTPQQWSELNVGVIGSYLS